MFLHTHFALLYILSDHLQYYPIGHRKFNFCFITIIMIMNIVVDVDFIHSFNAYIFVYAEIWRNSDAIPRKIRIAEILYACFVFIFDDISLERENQQHQHSNFEKEEEEETK